MLTRLIIILLLTVSLQSTAQIGLSTKSKKAIELYTEADNYRVRGQFAQAITLLQQAIEKDKEFVEAYYRLGLVYMTRKDYEQAIKNFEKGLSFTNDIRKQKVFWFDLGEAYFNTGDYDKAEKMLSDFLRVELQSKPRIDRARMLYNNIVFAKENKDKRAAYKQKVLSDTVNRFPMQYFPVLTADQQELIFTRREGFRDEFDEDLVVSRKDKQGKWTAPESIAKNINSSFNEGTCTISADGRKLIFTSCLGRQGYGSCDLFESNKIGNEWTKPQNLGPGVNSSEWESQPSLSADGRTLYFVSDRRGGVGRRDIWVSTLGPEGTWTKARNVGKPVNTEFDEISPFIHANNRLLYFASTGLTGYGGYDIFFSERDTASKWTQPKNIGAPINNHEDQFSLFITADGVKGYYSHEEPIAGGHSISKIIEMEIPEESRIKFRSNYVEGLVTDRETGKPLKGNIELINLATNQTESFVQSDSITGEYLIVLTQGSEYGLYVSKTGYVYKSLNFNYSEVKDFKPIVLNVQLDKIKEGSGVILENIFFDVDKYELKEKSIVELQKVLKFLKDNPNIKIEISGHTDNTGSPTHNLELSEKRAQAVSQYIISQGISKSRLTAKGYGSKNPIADNSTADGKQRNRRIEFKLIQN
ncbi:OmpA family protein [Chryseosolibacter indicus]|uniref:OmpA family protein n=1 Tax=Chryseosolibacter indicus TaxID=2782351 RepID=A0ABS5VQQ5_9BACT|nr:OmpA family protein [Chryseosolibacter indicus]MBT1703132.1 OmpA family protein [Chryseosolibacter indicus]